MAQENTHPLRFLGFQSSTVDEDEPSEENRLKFIAEEEAKDAEVPNAPVFPSSAGITGAGSASSQGLRSARRTNSDFGMGSPGSFGGRKTASKTASKTATRTRTLTEREDRQPHQGRFFVEMDELEYIVEPGTEGDVETGNGPTMTPLFVESARWIRGWEEDVEYTEEGEERFSGRKTGAATLHGFVALRHELGQGVILLDIRENSTDKISEAIVDALIEKRALDRKHKQATLDALTAHHHHAQTKERHSMLEARKARQLAKSLKRFRKNSSFSDVLKIPGMLSKINAGEIELGEEYDAQELQTAVDQLTKDMAYLENNPDYNAPEADHDDIAFDVLVGATPFLDEKVTAFVRLKKPVQLGDWTEEGYKTRHIFCCLGKKDDTDEVWEIGRSFAVLMAQEEWGDAIDTAESPSALLKVLDKFMDEAVIVPQLSKTILDSSNNNLFTLHEAAHDDKLHEIADESQPLIGAHRHCCGALLSGQVKTKGFIMGMPLHLDGAHRRMQGVKELQAASADDRFVARQHKHDKGKGDSDDELDMPGGADRVHMTEALWTRKQLFFAISAMVWSFTLVALAVTWLGPAIKANEQAPTHSLHHVHFGNGAAEVSGMAALTQSTPYVFKLEEDAGGKLAIFDVRLIAQRELVFPGYGKVEAMLYARQADGSDKACLDEKLTLLLQKTLETELAATVDFSAACDLKLGGFWQLTTDVATPVGVMFGAESFTAGANNRVGVSAALLAIVYLAIVTEVCHRTLCAMIGAFSSLLLLATYGHVTTMETAVVWVNEGTLALLFGMMIIVSLLSTTGLFEWCAIKALEVSKGNLAKLMTVLCFTTAFFSAFLDNVTTMLLLAPVTIELSDILGIDPVPLLVSEAIFANIGGASTMLSGPDNMMIGNHLNVSFPAFVLNLLPCVLISTVVAMAYLLFHYRAYLKKGVESFDIAYLKIKHQISNPVMLVKSGIVLFFVLLLMLMHPLHHIDPAWVACVGAVGLMIIATPHELHHVIQYIEWDTLLFLGSLFIMIEALATMGLVDAISQMVKDAITATAESDRLRVVMAEIVWFSAFFSGCLDSIPYTATMLPVLKLAVADPELDMPIGPLAWALSLGVAFGSNMCVVGSASNFVTVGAAERAGHKISFMDFFKAGFPVMILTTLVAMGYCIIVYK